MEFMKGIHSIGHPNITTVHCNHQFSKMLVLQIKFDDRAVMLMYTICHIVTGILTLIGGLTCCKEANIMGSINFKMVFFFQYHMLLVQLELPLCGNSNFTNNIPGRVAQ